MANILSIAVKNISRWFGATFEEDIQQFAQSFSSLNVRLRGDLILFSSLKGDLSSLTFEQYKHYLSVNPGSSSKQVYKIVAGCKDYTFTPSLDSFKIILCSKKLGITIAQDAREVYYSSVKKV